MKVLLLSASAALACVSAQAAANLVANPSFEDDEVAFTWKRMESPRVAVKAKDDPRYVSCLDTRHAKDGQRAWFLRCENPDGRNTMTFTNLSVTAGRRYAFKAHYRIDEADGTTSVWGNYHEHDAANKTSGYENLVHFDATPGRWNEFGCAFYASPNSTTVNVELIFCGRMSVWVDVICFSEEPEPAIPPVGAKLSETDAFSLAWLSPITKATPTGFPEGLKDGDGVVHLDAAKNERESFQLVIGAKRNLGNVAVKVSDFVREKGFLSSLFGGADARIPSDAATVREVKFVPVAGVGVKNPRMNRLHPDPVVPFLSGSASSGSNLVVLVSVKVPSDAKAGVYEAKLAIFADDACSVTVPIRLRVRDFALPDTALLRSYFYFSPDAFGRSYSRFDSRPADVIIDDIHAHYRELRITGNQAAQIPPPKWKFENGRVVITDWTPYDGEVERLAAKYNFSTFPVPFVGMLGDNQGWFKGDGGRGVKTSPEGRTVGNGPKETPFGGFFDEPDGQRHVIEALSQFAAHAKEKFPSAMFCWYIYDEPPYDVMDVLPKLVKTYVDALPQIKFLVVHTTDADRLEHYGIRVAHFDPATVNPQVRNFETSWYYQYPAVITDSDYLRGRFFPWQVYQADGEGVLLWDVAFYGNPTLKRSRIKAGDPWQNPSVAYENAYTTVFYPPRPGTGEGVVPSIRAVNIGDAIEDFDYLKLYEAKFGRAAVKELLSSVLPVATALPVNPVAFLKLRRKMAEALEGRLGE